MVTQQLAQQRHSTPYRQRQGAVLRAIRQERRLNQTQVAYRMGLTTEAYRLYERGNSALRTEQLPTLAAALEVPLSELVERLIDVEVPESEQPDPYVQVEHLLTRLAGSPEAGLALASAASHWRELSPTSVRAILHTLTLALESRGRDRPE